MKLIILLSLLSIGAHAQIIRESRQTYKPTPNVQRPQNTPPQGPVVVRTNPTNWNQCGNRPCGILSENEASIVSELMPELIANPGTGFFKLEELGFDEEKLDFVLMQIR